MPLSLGILKLERMMNQSSDNWRLDECTLDCYKNTSLLTDTSENAALMYDNLVIVAFKCYDK